MCAYCVAVVERWGDERTGDWWTQGLAGNRRNKGNDKKILQMNDESMMYIDNIIELRFTKQKVCKS